MKAIVISTSEMENPLIDKLFRKFGHPAITVFFGSILLVGGTYEWDMLDEPVEFNPDFFKRNFRISKGKLKKILTCMNDGKNFQVTFKPNKILIRMPKIRKKITDAVKKQIQRQKGKSGQNPDIIPVDSSTGIGSKCIPNLDTNNSSALKPDFFDEREDEKWLECKYT